MKRSLGYPITANGVYRCCKYLVNLTFYDDENGWLCESDEMQRYSYKKILKFLRNNFSHVVIMGYKYYDGEVLWGKFFISDKYLFERIQKRRLGGISELHYRANEAANWR